MALCATLLAAGGCERSADAPGQVAEAPRTPEAASARPTPPLSEALVDSFRLIEQRQTGPARMRLHKHLALHPDDGQAAFLFGLTYHREKRYNLARPWFERALEHAPGYDPVHHFFGWSLYYLGESEAARAQFEAHLRARPLESDSHFALGLIELDADDLDAAEERFDRALELIGEGEGNEKDVSKVLTRRAEVYVRRGELERAREDLVRAGELFPDHYETHFKLMRVLLRLGEDEAAASAEERFRAAWHRVHPGTSFPE